MVDSDEFIRTLPDGSLGWVKWKELVSRLFSSYVLAWFAGAAAFLYAMFEVPAKLLEDLLSWIGETLGLGFTVPAGSIEEAWMVVKSFFPIAGPFDWAIGVLLVATFFVAVNWMVSRVREGL